MGRPPDAERKARRSKSKASPGYQQKKEDEELLKLHREFGMPRRVTRSMSKNRSEAVAPNYSDDAYFERLDEPPMNQRKPYRASAQRQYPPQQQPPNGYSDQAQYRGPYGQPGQQGGPPNGQPGVAEEEKPFCMFVVPSYEAYKRKSQQFEKTIQQLEDAMDGIQREYNKFGMIIQ